MADKTYGTIVTDLGVSLITAATMEGRKVNITHLAVGDGNGAYYQPVPIMTALKNEKWRGGVNGVSINEQSPNMIDVVAVVPSSVGGWTIREMAIFDDAGNMIAICNTPDTEKVIITSGAAGEIELTMHIEISNTGAISFVIDPTVITATKKDIEKHDVSQAAHKAAFDKKANVIELNTHANNSDIHVNPTTMGNYNVAIAGLIEHTEDTNSHATAAEKASWTAGTQTAVQAAGTAAQAMNKNAELESRIARVEDGLFSNITGNPFLVSFDSLNGITIVKGVWNSVQQRIEC
ncbi:MAG: phage tail protein [Anaerotignum propionicum]|uniref:phage tail protein n=1 Tax=Anaerotignum propionicum TaxID=28446 RepID=UPI002B20C221|nr:phage tail protein [Anaerotignum propionicum]MEA5057783.1 phage tail protein [Anaerotignum propionicum]